MANTDDVATQAGGEAIVRAALDAFGRIDVVVANAGIIKLTPFAQTTLAEFNRHLEVHVAGSFTVCRAAWPHLEAQGYGRVVLTTSVGMLGAPPIAGYASAKAGVMGLMRALASAGEGCGIKANAICPWGMTRMVASAGEHNTGGTTDEDRALRPDAVSPAVAVLAHESCPVSGEVVFAAGGVVGRVVISETRATAEPGHTPEDMLEHWDTVMDLRGAYQSRDSVEANRRRREQILGAEGS